MKELENKSENKSEVAPLVSNAALESLQELVAKGSIDQSVLQQLATTSESKKASKESDSVEQKVEDQSFLNIKSSQTFITDFLDYFTSDLIKELSEKLASLEHQQDSLVIDQLYHMAHTLKGRSRLIDAKIMEHFYSKFEDFLELVKSKKIDSFPWGVFCPLIRELLQNYRSKLVDNISEQNIWKDEIFQRSYKMSLELLLKK